MSDCLSRFLVALEVCEEDPWNEFKVALVHDSAEPMIRKEEWEVEQEKYKVLQVVVSGSVGNKGEEMELCDHKNYIWLEDSEHVDGKLDVEKEHVEMNDEELTETIAVRQSGKDNIMEKSGEMRNGDNTSNEEVVREELVEQ
ncbi:hypothetical protein NDU88_005582 [Pleurodeles waltl]|uniref:Uncharacterized protein n=1 Tax=Pleurodeles waltl TaxID=8319 RepID=A0AAV7SM68_PLEWA|nr:hypothetical protein NDU88_005582 [Pleurodeles waltl]